MKKAFIVDEKIKPVGARVLVKEIPPDFNKVTKGGIHLPANRSDQDLARGEVLAVPDYVPLVKGGTRPCLVKAGDKIVYEKYRGSDVDLSGSQYILLDEVDVLGVIEDESVLAEIDY